MTDPMGTSRALLDIPEELLDIVIVSSLPEGFESLALTCTRLFSLCQPYIKHHNDLKRQYADFSYGLFDKSYPVPITTAVHLITRIIAEPAVSRYIRHANFQFDSQQPFVEGHAYDVAVEDQHLDRLVAFLTQSSMLKSLGFNVKEYANVTKEDVMQHRRYSQNAAAFLLTMLPNLESLSLPQLWKPDAMSEKLLNRLTTMDAALDPPLIAHNPVLQRLRAFTSPTSQSNLAKFEMAWARPFLRSPCIQSILGYSFVDTLDSPDISTSSNSAFPWGITEHLWSVQLRSSCLSHESIRKLLQGAPNLRRFCYQHRAKDGITPSWNVTQFLDTIAEYAGPHLTELSLRPGMGADILPADTCSFRDRFPLLKILELPIGIFRDSTVAEIQVRSPPVDIHYSYVIPRSAVKVALVGRADNLMCDGESPLKRFFRGFPDESQVILPDLRELHISCQAPASNAYKLWCVNLQQRCKDSGFSVHLQQFSHPILTVET